MKSITKIINILLIISMLVIPFIHVKADEVEKGDLRCPLNLSNGTTCELSSDGNSVSITYDDLGDENIQVVKVVEKVDGKLGQYKVYFKVRGKNIKSQIKYDDTRVVLILDMSRTVLSSENEIINATKAFNDRFSSRENVDVAIIQFATNACLNKRFTDKNYSLTGFNGNCFSVDTGRNVSLKTQSNVEKALAKAQVLLSGLGDEKKYIIVLGDGQYWDGDDTNVEEARRRFRELRYSNVNLYMIQYTSRSSKYNEGYKKNGQYNHYFIRDYIVPTKWWCNYGNHDYSTRNWCANDKVLSYDSIFKEIEKSIINDISGEGKNVEIVINDKVGSSFSLVDGSSRLKKLSIEDVRETFKSTSSFNIQIDEYVREGWHNTNDGFTLTYVSKDNLEHTLTFNDNPEVYWVSGKQEINSCSGVATYDTIRNDDSDLYSYYNVICQEGYLKNNDYKKGFSVDININNLEDDVKKFNTGSFGFPANIKLSTNLVCQYKFDYEKYKKDYDNYTNGCNKLTGKEQASMCKSKKELEEILDNYKNIVSEDILNYEERFKEQKATLTVIYDKLNTTELTEFVDVSEIASSVKCEDTLKKTINGKDIIVNQTCYASFSKEMGLKNSCLDVKSGEQVDCINSNTQINGGNKFYANLKADGGKIYVDLKNAGKSESLNIKLKDCSFTSNQIDYNVIYRQIDLNDPFLENYDKERTIGENYLNTKYDFTNIINDSKRKDGKTWEIKFDYRYSLSKGNVEKIRKDTKEEGVSSYLGRNCYVSNYKYVCDFTRNKSTNDGVESQRDWFTKVEINE